MVIEALSVIGGVTGAWAIPAIPAPLWAALAAGILVLCIIGAAHAYLREQDNVLARVQAAYETDESVRAWRALESQVETCGSASLSAADMFLECAHDMAAGFDMYEIVDYMSARRGWKNQDANVIAWVLLTRLQAAGAVETTRVPSGGPAAGSELPAITLRILSRGHAILAVGGSERHAHNQDSG